MGKHSYTSLQAINVFGYGQRLKSPTSSALYSALLHGCLKCGSPLKAQQVTKVSPTMQPLKAQLMHAQRIDHA